MSGSLYQIPVAMPAVSTRRYAVFLLEYTDKIALRAECKCVGYLGRGKVSVEQQRPGSFNPLLQNIIGKRTPSLPAEDL